jgi:predicted metal-dependent hydrolase
MQYYENIPYTLKKSRKRRKTISLQISDKSELVIAAPHFTPISEINRFVQEKQNWISKAIQKHKEALIKNRAKEYITGEHFYYLGESYPLEVFFEPLENAGVVFWGNRFFLNAQEKKDLRKHYFVLWYKKKAREYIGGRVDFYSKMLKLQPGSLKITSAESRWGSCSEDDNLAFSFRLIMAPPLVIDYVIVHELMHIKEKNHSAKFWQLVESVMPQYKLHRRWLKDNNSKFVL